MFGEHNNKLRLKGYKKLFESLYPQLCVFAYGYLNDLELSKDMVQEVFLKAWEDNIAFKNENQTTDFFYKAVKSKCLNYLKNKQDNDSPLRSV